MYIKLILLTFVFPTKVHAAIFHILHHYKNVHKTQTKYKTHTERCNIQMSGYRFFTFILHAS